MRANCWTCRHSGTTRRGCDRLTLDEETDAPILAWLQDAPLRGDGTVPGTADGCPGWEPRSECVLVGVVGE